MKKAFLLLLGLVYLMPGSLFAYQSVAHQYRSFECVAPNTPHGTVGVHVESFQNPDLSRCTRSGFSADMLIVVPVLLLIGTPILVIKIARIYGPRVLS